MVNLYGPMAYLARECVTDGIAPARSNGSLIVRSLHHFVGSSSAESASFTLRSKSNKAKINSSFSKGKNLFWVRS